MATRNMVQWWLASVVLPALLAGCSGKKVDEPHVFMLGDFLAAKELPYDSPPQVIYRIDDHRYVTLERYRDCNYGETYYNDKRNGIRTELGRASVEDFQGRLINADPTGKNLAFAAALPPGYACPDRGCRVYLWYSTDSGKTFFGFQYMPPSAYPFEDSKGYTVAMTNDKLYVAKNVDGDALVETYPLFKNVNLNESYSQEANGDRGWESARKLMPSSLRTPSGDDRIHCNASIKPTNPDAPLKRDDQ